MLMVYRRNRGVTLMETVIALGIMTFIFSALAFLIYFTGRNSYIVHEQVQSQTNAASAVERIANMLRNAETFDYHGSDDENTTPLLKLAFGIPDIVNDTVTTGIVAFKAPSKKGATDGVVQIYEDISDYNSKEDPDWAYENIAKFSIIKQSPFWANFRISYVYRGFILSDVDSNNDGYADSSLAGEFVTDVIAKNHHTGENTNADFTTSTLVSL